MASSSMLRPAIHFEIRFINMSFFLPESKELLRYVRSSSSHKKTRYCVQWNNFRIERILKALFSPISLSALLKRLSSSSSISEKVSTALLFTTPLREGGLNGAGSASGRRLNIGLKLSQISKQIDSSFFAKVNRQDELKCG